VHLATTKDRNFDDTIIRSSKLQVNEVSELVNNLISAKHHGDIVPKSVDEVTRQDIHSEETTLIKNIVALYSTENRTSGDGENIGAYRETEIRMKSDMIKEEKNNSEANHSIEPMVTKMKRDIFSTGRKSIESPKKQHQPGNNLDIFSFVSSETSSKEKLKSNLSVRESIDALREMVGMNVLSSSNQQKSQENFEDNTYAHINEEQTNKISVLGDKDLNYRQRRPQIFINTAPEDDSEGKYVLNIPGDIVEKEAENLKTNEKEEEKREEKERPTVVQRTISPKNTQEKIDEETLEEIEISAEQHNSRNTLFERKPEDQEKKSIWDNTERKKIMNFTLPLLGDENDSLALNESEESVKMQKQLDLMMNLSNENSLDLLMGLSDESFQIQKRLNKKMSLTEIKDEGRYLPAPEVLKKIETGEETDLLGLAHGIEMTPLSSKVVDALTAEGKVGKKQKERVSKDRKGDAKMYVQELGTVISLNLPNDAKMYVQELGTVIPMNSPNSDVDRPPRYTSMYEDAPKISINGLDDITGETGIKRDNLKNEFIIEGSPDWEPQTKPRVIPPSFRKPKLNSPGKVRSNVPMKKKGTPRSLLQAAQVRRAALSGKVKKGQKTSDEGSPSERAKAIFIYDDSSHISDESLDSDSKSLSDSYSKTPSSSSSSDDSTGGSSISRSLSVDSSESQSKTDTSYTHDEYVTHNGSGTPGSGSFRNSESGSYSNYSRSFQNPTSYSYYSDDDSSVEEEKGKAWNLW